MKWPWGYIMPVNELASAFWSDQSNNQSENCVLGVCAINVSRVGAKTLLLSWIQNRKLESKFRKYQEVINPFKIIPKKKLQEIIRFWQKLPVRMIPWRWTVGCVCSREQPQQPRKRNLYRPKQSYWVFLGFQRQSPWVETGAFPWQVGGGKRCLQFFHWTSVLPLRLAIVATQVPFQFRDFVS